MRVWGRDDRMRFKISLDSLDFLKILWICEDSLETPSCSPVRGTRLIKVQSSRWTLGEAVWGCLEPSMVPTLCP